jgi:glutathione S-transferase
LALQLWFHPLASFCWKTLVALYENDTPFEPVFLDLADPAVRARFAALGALGQMPVLVDDGQAVPEASIGIEHLDRHHPGPTRLLPSDPDLALRARLLDRVFDLHVQVPMQKIVTDRIRPEGARDPHGVEEARARLATGLDWLEGQIGAPWALGDAFSLADCAALPALYYANEVRPFSASHPRLAAYLGRLSARPSGARVLAEAGPYLGNFPRD